MVRQEAREEVKFLKAELDAIRRNDKRYTSALREFRYSLVRIGESVVAALTSSERLNVEQRALREKIARLERKLE